MSFIQLFQKRVIERNEGIPYLIRWTIFGIGKDSRYFSIKLHKILQSDSENLHDHPWKFISIILKGGYVETTKFSYKLMEKGWDNCRYSECNECNVLSKIIWPGTIIKRPANWAHSLQINKPCWTLVFTFKKTKSWGFFTPKGYINWKDYGKSDEC